MVAPTYLTLVTLGRASALPAHYVPQFQRLFSILLVFVCIILYYLSR